MQQIYIGLGSNIDPENNLVAAARILHHHFPDIVFSKIVKSAAYGFDGDPFWNLAAAFSCSTSIGELAGQLRQIETQMGRKRQAKKFSARTLDIDLLLFGDYVFHNSGIHVPHLDITLRSYVLAPLCELCPAEMHPILKRTYMEMWREFDSNSHPLTTLEPILNELL